VREATTFNSCISKAKMLNRNTLTPNSATRDVPLAETNTKRELIIM
jgi:hypothetical protein